MSSELTREQSMAMIAEVHDLELKRIPLVSDASDEASVEMDRIGDRIEHLVVCLVRDTQHDADLHKEVMDALDREEVEMDRLGDYLTKEPLPRPIEDSDFEGGRLV